MEYKIVVGVVGERKAHYDQIEDVLTERNLLKPMIEEKLAELDIRTIGVVLAVEEVERGQEKAGDE